MRLTIQQRGLGNWKRRRERRSEKRERRIGDGGKRRRKYETRVRKKGAVGETGTLSTEEKTRISSFPHSLSILYDLNLSTSPPLSEKLQPPAGCSSQEEGRSANQKSPRK
jgi:hypothetical protein